MTAPVPADRHVPSETLAGFIDRRLDAAAGTVVIEHLADCAECRREWMDARRALQPRRARRVAGITVGLAAAASLLVAVWPSGRAGLDEADRVRAGGDTPALVAYGPLGEIATSTIELVWGSAGAEAAYRVAITTTDGSPVWRASTADTTAAPPDTLQFAPATAYRWWVDALLPDGTTRTTGVREFRTPP